MDNASEIVADLDTRGISVRVAAVAEPGLVDRILEDVGEDPGNLPLLEFALTLLWEGQANGKLTCCTQGQGLQSAH